jgi:hypothetical protein
MSADILHTLSNNPGLAFVLGGLLAGLCTSLFVLIWYSLHGSLITNLSLSLEMKRTEKGGGQKHNLVIVLKIIKENTNALTLESIKLELFSLDQNDLDEAIKKWYDLPENTTDERRKGDIWMPVRRPNETSLNRSLNRAGNLYSERRVLAFWTPDDARAENLVPSEKTQYASYSTIEPNDAYEVVVTLSGRRYRSQLYKSCFRRSPATCYYTASTISVPADAQVSVPADASVQVLRQK